MQMFNIFEVLWRLYYNNDNNENNDNNGDTVFLICLFSWRLHISDDRPHHVAPYKMLYKPKVRAMLTAQTIFTPYPASMGLSIW